MVTSTLTCYIQVQDIISYHWTNLYALVYTSSSNFHRLNSVEIYLFVKMAGLHFFTEQKFNLIWQKEELLI